MLLQEVLKHGFLTSLQQLHTRNEHRARSFLEALKLQTAADLQRFGRKELQEALGPELRPFWEVLCRLSRGFSAFVSCPVVPARATHAACPYWGFSFRPDGFAHCRERITSLIFIVSDSALLPPARCTAPPPPPPPPTTLLLLLHSVLALAQWTDLLFGLHPDCGLGMTGSDCG